MKLKKVDAICGQKKNRMRAERGRTEPDQEQSTLFRVDESTGEILNFPSGQDEN